MIRTLQIIIYGLIPLAALVFFVMGMKHGESFYSNIATELIGILITVFILDQLNNFRSKQILKQTLIRQVGSNDNALALGAIKELDHYGWLYKPRLFQDAWLRKANLSEGSLFGVDFSGASLEEANFTNSDLTNNNFDGSDIRLVKFNGAILLGASLEARIVKTSFVGAYLQEASFGSAMLFYADFTNAIIQGTDFSKAELRDAIFKGALYDKSTKWPDGFLPQKHGAKLTENKIPVIKKEYLDLA